MVHVFCILGVSVVYSFGLEMTVECQQGMGASMDQEYFALDEDTQC